MDLNNIEVDTDKMEESKKNEYIDNHFADLKQRLEVIGINFFFAMQNAIIIEKIMKSKKPQ